MIDKQALKKLETVWNRPLIASIIFFIVVFGIFAVIFAFSDGDPVPDDEYFHFRYAQLLRTQGWNAVENFDWIYLTNSAKNGSRYTVTLYQVSLIPFTYFRDQLMGMHMAIAFYMSIVMSIIYYIMRKERVRYPLFFTILLLTSSYFLARTLLGRSFVLMTGLIFLEMYFAIHKKYLPLFFVVLFHVLWHQSTYFLPLIVVGMVEVARYITYFAFNLKSIIITFIAAVGGMMFYPGFPGSLFGWMRSIIVIQGGDAQATSGSLSGAELATKDFMTYFVGQEMILLMFVVSIVTVVYVYVAQKKHIVSKDVINKDHMHWLYTLFIFLLFVTYGSSVVSGRFFDFVFLTLVMLFAFVVTIIKDAHFIVINKNFHTWFAVACWVWLIALSGNSLIYVYAKSNSYDYTPAKSASAWIESHSQGREKVYLHNWGNFSLMFYGNVNNVYSTGIEPAALKSYDPVLYWKYYNILAHDYYCDRQEDCADIVDVIEVQLQSVNTQNKEKFIKKNSENVIHSIKNDFGATFIVSDSEKFDNVILTSPELIDVWYTTDSEKFSGPHMHFTVFKLK